MRREQIQKKEQRHRDRRNADLPPLSTRELFYPYPIRPRDTRSERTR
jgi:hypothetical protein